MKNKLIAMLAILALCVSPIFGQANYQGQAAVTQITSLTTGVTLDAPAGVITTFNATTAAASVSSFVVSSKAVTANQVVIPSILNYSGTYFTNGVPYVTITGVSAGSFTVNVINTHATNALAGVLKIGFVAQ